MRMLAPLTSRWKFFMTLLSAVIHSLTYLAASLFKTLSTSTTTLHHPETSPPPSLPSPPRPQVDPPLSPDQMQQQTRWAAAEAARLLKTHDGAYQSLVGALEQKCSVAECIAKLETAKQA